MIHGLEVAALVGQLPPLDGVHYVTADGEGYGVSYGGVLPDGAVVMDEAEWNTALAAATGG